MCIRDSVSTARIFTQMISVDGNVETSVLVRDNGPRPNISGINFNNKAFVPKVIKVFLSLCPKISGQKFVNVQATIGQIKTAQMRGLCLYLNFCSNQRN